MKANILQILACAVSATALPGLVSAQDSNAEPRTALLIGISAYNDTYFNELKSPKVDADKMEQQLRALGFVVDVLKNSGRKQMVEAIDQFGDKLAKRGGVGLFYYSGHGVQLDQENYMVPMDTDIKSTRDLPQEAVAAQRVLNRMSDAKNRLNLIFLDACRSNGIPSEAKGSSTGLAAMRGGSGLMVFFAAQPGQPAFDSAEGTGSIFTSALLNHLQTPGVSLMDMMADVTAETETLSDKMSNGRERQTPFISGSLSGRFYFVPGNGSSLPPPPQPPMRSMKTEDSPPPPATTPGNGNGDVFHGSPYAGYNDYSKEMIIRRLQRLLSDTGFFTGVVDGRAGPEVRQALTEYQRTYNLSRSGELDSITLRQLKLDGIEEHRQTVATPPPKTTVKTPKRTAESEPPPRPVTQPAMDLDAKFKQAAEQFEKKK